MTSDPITFAWAEIEGFRGFRDRQRIELGSSVVILSGPNGTGKTSFFDALQWLLLGSIERLEPWRSRRNTEHIASAFRPGEPAIVRAGAILGGTEVELRRQGRHDSGVLEWTDHDGTVRGDDAEDRLLNALSPGLGGKQSLRRLLMTSGLLQQDVVREVLEDKAADRYEQLASLLGLDALASFEAATRRRADRLESNGKSARSELAALERQHLQTAQQIEALRAQLTAAPDTARIREQLSGRIAAEAATVRLLSELPSTMSDALLLQSRVAEIGDELTRLAGRIDVWRAGRADDAMAVSEEALSMANREASEATRRASAAREALAKADSELASGLAASDATVALAHAALPLLSDRCPVCEQTIDKKNVERHLQELLERGGIDLTQLRANRDAAQLSVRNSENIETKARQQLEGLVEAQRRRERRAEEQRQIRAALAEVVVRAHDIGLQLPSDELLREDRALLDSTIEGLRAIWRIAGELTSVLHALPAGDELARREADLQRLDDALRTARGATSSASAREEEARVLQRAATRAATAVADTRFRLLAPLVGDIFLRLDPHPVFKTLDFALGVYRERGVATPVVRDDQAAIEADPLVVFSSAQANVAALAYFLALGWAAGPDSMPFVLLDDPLQSLDDVNALAFADLCRHVRRQRQLIVATHDRRLAALLERKLAPRTAPETTRVVEFKSWSRSGPELEFRTVPPQITEGRDRNVVVTQAA